MKTDFDTAPVDMMAVDLRARRLRAEAIARGCGSIRRWVAAPFQKRTAEGV